MNYFAIFLEEIRPFQINSFVPNVPFSRVRERVRWKKWVNVGFFHSIEKEACLALMNILGCINYVTKNGYRWQQHPKC